MNREELIEAKRIVDAWSLCVPGHDCLAAAQGDRDKSALELEAQKLINESEDPVLLWDFFQKSGLDCKLRLTSRQELSLWLMVVAIVLILLGAALFYFSSDLEISRKDVLKFTATGVVLISAVGAVVSGISIFGPKVKQIVQFRE